MASSTEEVSVRLKLERAKQFQAGMAGAGKSVNRFGKETSLAARKAKLAAEMNTHLTGTLRAVGRAARTAAFFGFAALGAGIYKSVKAAADSRAIGVRTAAVIKSTGGIANASAEHIDRMSASIQRQTGVQDDLVHSGANLLLTFTNIQNQAGRGNKIFDRATATVVNMSKALGQDTKSSAIQLGKALNDPIKGITALKRVGVSFTAAQQKQITTLVQTGHTLEAQKIILRELGKEFPKVKATPLERLKNAAHDLEITLGKKLLPTVRRGEGYLARLVTQIDDGTGSGGRLVRKLKALWLQVKAVGKVIYVDLIKPLAAAIKWIASSGDRLKALAFGLGLLVAIMIAVEAPAILAALEVAAVYAGIVLLGAGIYYAYKRCKIFRDVVNWVATALKNVAKWLIGAAPVAFHVLERAVSAVWAVFKLSPTGYVITHLGKIIAFVKGMPGKISSAATGIWDGLKGGLVSVLNWAIAKINLMIRGFNKINPFHDVGQISPLSSPKSAVRTVTGGGPNGNGRTAAALAPRSAVVAHSMSTPGGTPEVHVYIGDKAVDKYVTKRIVKTSKDKARAR